MILWKLLSTDEIDFILPLFRLPSHLTLKPSGLSTQVFPPLLKALCTIPFPSLDIFPPPFIKSGNKTKWKLTAQLVFDSQMFAEDQMRHFLQSGSPFKFRIVSSSMALSRSADAPFYSWSPLWLWNSDPMFWQFCAPYSCSNLIYRI